MPAQPINFASLRGKNVAVVGAGASAFDNAAAALEAGAAEVHLFCRRGEIQVIQPYRWLTFAGRLTADISDFTPGTVPSVGRLPGGSFGVFICYEAVFPAEIRRFTVGGAELLVNISNDGWFGRSSAPAQHLMMARVRAVENRRWLLRDTNNGFTAAVDPYGRMVARLPTDVRGELDAPYDFRSGLTPYARFGDWFAWLCVIAAVAIIGMAVWKKFR